MDTEHARALLARERERIERATLDLRPEGADDPGDEGSQTLYQNEFDEGLVPNLDEQRAALERAEARLAAGTYGFSVESGVRIPDERLEALPTAERTVEEERARGAR